MLEHMVRDDVLDRFYKFGLGFQRANGFMGRVAKQIAHRYPRANILEIGAGTGGATKGILESLGDTFESYTYTDISTGFFEAAATLFEDWERAGFHGRKQTGAISIEEVQCQVGRKEDGPAEGLI